MNITKLWALICSLLMVLSGSVSCENGTVTEEDISVDVSQEASSEESESSESPIPTERTNYALGKNYTISGKMDYLSGKGDDGSMLTDGFVPLAETEGQTVAFSGTGASNSINVDLGQIYTEIDEIVVAGVVVSGNRQYASVTIEASESGYSYTALSNYTENGVVYSDKTNNYHYNFDSEITARYVKITFVSSAYVLTIGDIQVYGGDAVKDPDPEGDRAIKYTEDKSGYLENTVTNSLNFNSKTIKAKDFSGVHSGTKLDGEGRLTLQLADGLYSGYFESNVMNVGSFGTMLISWNALCGDGKIEVLVSYEATGGSWSDYFSYGVWSDKNYTSTSKSVNNSFGKMNVDTFVPSKTTTGNIKYKIIFTRVGDHIPVVENITISTPTMGTSSPGTYPSYAWNKVPMRSQHAPENGADGGVMCSATTAAMALEYLGYYQTTYETAMGTWDVEFEGYGNWLFSSAEAAAHGYFTFCDFYTEDMMKYALSKGYVLGCSTYLTSSGHIVLVVGYETVDGVDYYIVNDPNVSASNPQVTRYTCEYFNSVWIKNSFNNTGVVYVFQGQY